MHVETVLLRSVTPVPELGQMHAHSDGALPLTTRVRIPFEGLIRFRQVFFLFCFILCTQLRFDSRVHNESASWRSPYGL